MLSFRSVSIEFCLDKRDAYQRYVVILDFIVKVGATLIGVSLAGYIAYWRYRIEQNDKRETAVAFIFDELLNIYEHYTYVAYETSNNLFNADDHVLYMRMSKAGPLSSATATSELGNLSAEQINELLQLNVRIRNTDLILDRAIESDKKLTKEMKETILDRTILCKTTAENLINSISESREKLGHMFVELKSRLVTIE